MLQCNSLLTSGTLLCDFHAENAGNICLETVAVDEGVEVEVEGLVRRTRLVFVAVALVALDGATCSHMTSPRTQFIL